MTAIRSMTPATIRMILDEIRYKDWKFELSELTDPTDGNDEGEKLALQLTFITENAYDGVRERQHGRRWLLEPMSESELLQTCWLAVMTAEEHEARERFKYRDRRVFNPHRNHAIHG